MISGIEIDMKPYKQISTAVVYANPWWKYCLDKIELPSGASGEYHYVRTHGSAMIIPVGKDGKLLLVRQYRYTGDRDSLEFPCGGLHEGASFEEAARNELIEETGFRAGSMEPMGSFNPCNGLVDEICRVYVARDLDYIGAQPDETESFELVPMTVEELDVSIRDGTIWDGMTLAAWAIVRPALP
jgi:ADP-ribose pyrophosphatase